MYVCYRTNLRKCRMCEYQKFETFLKIQQGEYIKRQNKSTEGCSKLKRSIDMTSSGMNGH